MTIFERLARINEQHKAIQLLMDEPRCDYNRFALDSKPDADEAYKKGLDDAWEALKKLYTDYTQGEIREIFSINTDPKDWEPSILTFVFRDFTGTEVIAKLRDYEARQKAEAEAIKVGDEVEHVDNTRIKVVVTAIFHDKRYAGFRLGDGAVYSGMEPNLWRKTGRRFPEIAAVLEQMKGE